MNMVRRQKSLYAVSINFPDAECILAVSFLAKSKLYNSVAVEGDYAQ